MIWTDWIRASRFARVRSEVRPDAGELLRLYDHFKPGVPEIAALLPSRLADALQVLAGCSEDPQFVALEVTEYNPLRDFGGQTAQAATELVCAMLAPEHKALGLAA